MRKFIAIVLALVIALSASAVAFAADVYTCPTCNKKYTTLEEYNACVSSHATSSDSSSSSEETIYECPICAKKFDNIYEYNSCIDAHHSNDAEYSYKEYVSLTLPELANTIVDLFNNTGIKDIFMNLFEKVWSLFLDIINKGTADIAAPASLA